MPLTGGARDIHDFDARRGAAQFSAVYTSDSTNFANQPCRRQ